MYNVIVLSDDEYNQINFLKEFGLYDNPNSSLCVYHPNTHDPVQLFRPDIFGLMTQDPKLDSFTRLKDGITITLHQKNINNNIVARIKEIVAANKNKPLMIIIEGEQSDDPAINIIRKECGIEHHAVFFIDTNYINKPGTCIIETRESILTGGNKYLASKNAKEWFKKQLEKTKNRINIKKTNSESDTKQVTSVNIPFETMAQQFEECRMSLALWDHYGRLKIVYYSLKKYGYNETINPDGWLCTNWRKYKTSVGHGRLWHYTLTRFWTKILYDLMITKKYKTFHDMYTLNRYIQNGKLFEKYYTKDILFTDHARANWVTPNLRSFN